VLNGIDEKKLRLKLCSFLFVFRISTYASSSWPVDGSHSC
jgi:hypothetical protein